MGAVMKRTLRYILVFILAAGPASRVFALHSPSNTNLDEINHHQAAASAALIMGDHTLLGRGDYSLSGQVFVSGWGADALYGSWGLSFQAGVGERWGLGLSYGYSEAQLRTRGWLVNGQYALVEGPRPWLFLQGAIGHRFLDSSESGNVLIFEFDDPWPIRPGNPQILLDDMTWTQGYLNALVQFQFWKIRPLASLGYVHSHYSWSGWEVPAFGGLDAGLGQELSDSGDIGTFIWTLGVGLDLGPFRPYAGLGVFTEGGLMMARVSFVF